MPPSPRWGKAYLYSFSTSAIQESHSGICALSEISAWQIRHNASLAFMLIQSPESKISMAVPSLKPCFFLSDCGITILPSLSTLLIFPPKAKSAPTEVSAPKNANSNCCYTKPDKRDNGIRHTTGGICIFAKFNVVCLKKGIVPPKK